MPSSKLSTILLRFSFFVFLLSSCAPTPTPSAPTLPPPVTSTPLPPTPDTPTPVPSTPDTSPPTPDSIPFGDTDILTLAQKDRLNQIAQAFVSSTQEEALAKAEKIGFVQYADPSNMCGPLSIAQLRDAGLLDRYVDPHDFWLMRPDTNAETIRKTFPEDRFEHFLFKQSTAEFDFIKFPLKAGDFIYLYSGKNGTFEHILTVTRVDEAGRAYTVTNLNTQPYPNYYYVIREVMLYDPAQPGVGQFYDWTNESKNNWIGLTGYGGFELWRFKTPVQDFSSAELNLADALDSIFADAGGQWHSLILDLEAGRVVHSRLSADAVHTASVIKVPVAMLLFKSLEAKNIPPEELPAYLASHGNGFLLSEALHDMLVDSDEKATEDLLEYIRFSGFNISSTLAKWGAPNVNVYRRTAPLSEIAHLFAGLYQGDFIEPQAREMLLDWMSEYSPNDDTRLGVLRSLLPVDGKLYNKRGSITDGRLVIGDAAIVTWDSRAYVILIFGYPGGETPTDDLKLVAAIEQSALAFWEFAK
ncbi:MAG: serine hydrolase [Chloroflexi bacterium]|nr:serine hydrolase [Chloroflexota bacterium]